LGQHHFYNFLLSPFHSHTVRRRLDVYTNKEATEMAHVSS